MHHHAGAGNIDSAMPRLPPELEIVSRSLLDRLSVAAGGLETTADWPAEQLRWLAEANVMGWCVPHAFGGSERSAAELLAGYIQLASACLTTTFILTQRNAAIQRIVAAEQAVDLQAELLPALARGDLFATVGISHLSTSRQHLARPAVCVGRCDGDFLLSGDVPWVTGACHADLVVTGGTLEDGRQVLLAVPTEAPGIRCGEPAQLLALSASGTASLTLDAVRLPASRLLAGPVAGVMKHGGGGTGSFGTSALAVGLALRAVRILSDEAARRPDLRAIVEPLDSELDGVLSDLLAAAQGLADDGGRALSPEALRQRANSLVLRATQAALAASKGAGFVAGHPAERAVREAMFFLVWSCPQPVVQAALREFACLVE